jgi:hypothetical protein
VSRAELGFVAAHLLLALPGAALLYALGIVRARPRDLLAAAGPAYLAGVAVTMTALIALMTLGLNVRLPQFLAAALGLTALLVAAGVAARRRGLREEPAAEPPSSAAERWGWRLTLAAIALLLFIGAESVWRNPTGGDDATIWTHKALALFLFDGDLGVGVLNGDQPGPAHTDYPILQPLLQTFFWRVMGGVNAQEFHSSLWVLFGAFVWTVGFLLRRRGTPRLVLLAPLAALAVMPGAAQFLTIGYADITVACFAGVGALCAALWLDGGPRRYALLSALFLAAAANTKNEGQLVAFAVVAAATVAVLVARPRPWRPAVGAAALLAALSLPWLAWRSANDIDNDASRSLGEALDWSFLSDNLDRLSKAFGRIFLQLADQGNWTFVLPVFIGLAGICIATATARRIAAFYLGAGTLVTLGLAWVYWTGLVEIELWLNSSTDRVVACVVFVAGAGATHLIARLAAAQPGEE